MNTFEKIKKTFWIIAVIARDGDVEVGSDFYPGARIKTRHGWGTVTGGNIMVTLDHPPYKDSPDLSMRNNKGWTFNLDSFRVGRKEDKDA